MKHARGRTIFKVGARCDERVGRLSARGLPAAVIEAGPSAQLQHEMSDELDGDEGDAADPCGAPGWGSGAGQGDGGETQGEGEGDAAQEPDGDASGDLDGAGDGQARAQPVEEPE